MANLTTTERRRGKRARFDGRARYETGRELGGHARVIDVDLGGLRIETTAALTPGTFVMLDVDAPNPSLGAVELKGQVLWTAGAVSDASFVSGVRVYCDEHAARAALCEMVCAGLKREGAIGELRDRHFVYVEWKMAGVLPVVDDDSTSIWRRISPSLLRRRIVTTALNY